MKLTQFTNLPERKHVFVLEIDDRDIFLTRLEPFDMLLQKECAESNLISDKLLWLENLSRRIEATLKDEK